jgi:hypothetical protein
MIPKEELKAIVPDQLYFIAGLVSLPMPLFGALLE